MSGEKRAKVKNLLKGSFRSRGPNSSPSPSPSPSTPANSPNTNVLSNVGSGSSIGANIGSSSGIVGGPAPPPGGQYLSPQPLTVFVPAKNEAFQRAMTVALLKHIDKLSNDDKAAFESAPDVMEKLQLNKSTSPHVQKVQKVLECLQQFLAPVAICIQQSPHISSLVVGGFNCVLILALNYLQFFDKLTNMMQRIGDHLSYLAKYALGNTLYSADVQGALVAAYGDLLDFYVKARGLFPKGKLSNLQGFRRFLRVTWEPFEAQFQSIENNFIHHTLIVTRSANVEYYNYYYNKESQEQQRIEDEKLSERHRKILKWLSPNGFEEIHDRHFRKRCQGTGEWLLGDSRFTSWKEDTQSKLLWCHGDPGSGKTILTSMVIDHLSECYEFSPNIGTTFIYCNYAEPRTSLEYIRLAIKQLCQKIDPLPPKLDQSYEKHYKNHSQPSFQELQDLFLTIAQQLDSMFFVLDALDECSPDQRADLYKFITGIVEQRAGMSYGTIKFFVASRKELDIEKAFARKSFPTIEIEAAKVDSDIMLYVKAQIEQRLDDGSLSFSNPILKDKIFHALTSKAGGMFLWVELQLEVICSQVSDYGIEQAFESIPETLDATYERILAMINKKPPAQRELARKALIFVAYARQQVSIDTLALAIAVKDSTASLNTLQSSISTGRMILNACSNLISIDKDSKDQYVRFVHFSVHEFLTRYRSNPDALLSALILEHEIAHREIAQMCMTFLLILYSQVKHYCSAIQRSFTNYILHALPHHLLDANLNSLPSNHEIVSLTLSFFEKSPPLLAPPNLHGPPLALPPCLTFFTFSPSVLALIFNVPGTPQHYDPELFCGKQLNPKVLKWIYEGVNSDYKYFVLLSDNQLAMHYAIGHLDSVSMAEKLYIHGYPIDYLHHNSNKPLITVHNLPKWVEYRKLHIPDFCKLTPLYSVKSGNMAKFLLDSGASVKPQVVDGKACHPLEHLAEGGNAEVVQLLFEKDPRTILHSSAFREIMLYNVAIRGDVKAMQILLAGGVGFNAQVGYYGNALQAAAHGGKVEVMELLLDHGANVNAHGGEYGHALQAAAYEGQIEAMRLLLDKGADVNAKGGYYGYALQAAAVRGEVEAMQLLLDNGTDIDAVGGYHGSALNAAAHSGKVRTMQFLVHNGAGVNAQAGLKGNALYRAAGSGEVEAMQFLLENGADINAQGGHHGSALEEAAMSGEVEAMQFLLNNGADINRQGGHYGNALQAAAFHGEVEALKFLLDNGMDVNVQGGENGNALQAAARRGEIKALQFLLDHKADINAQGGEHGYALQAAVCGANAEAIRLLLDNGANVHAQGGHHFCALHTAALHGNVEALQLLLDYGADVNVQGGDYGNALQGAAYQGHVEAMRFLLDQGVDVNIQGGHYGNALQAAAVSGEIEALQFLLDHKADINAQGGEYGYALQAAICGANVEAIRLLLDNGANVHAQGGIHFCALHTAALDDNVETLQLLLDYGADVNVQGGDYGNALQAAAFSGKIEALKFLLDNGMDVNVQGGKHGYALQAAARFGEIKALQFLLDHKADINAQGGEHGCALQAAVCDANIEAIRLLLDNGANVHAQGGIHFCALHTAALDDNVETLQLLLDYGADVNVQGGDYGNALQAAAFSGKIEALKFLLDNGMDVNIQGGHYGNALQAAASTGKIEVMQFLLDKGVDVNAQGGKYGCALQAAVCGANVEAIRLLLDNGANVHAQGGRHFCALHTAALEGNVEALRLLLDNGADINVEGGNYGNALQAAAFSGEIEALKFLLDNGMDVNIQGGHYGNALQAAASTGKIEVMQFLLDKGVDVNAQGGKYGTALQAALVIDIEPHYRRQKNPLHTARILLDHGADVTAYVAGSPHGDALSAAKELWKGDEDKLVGFMKLLELKGCKEGKSGPGENGLQV